MLEKYQNAYPGLIKLVILEKNQGLGLALRAGVAECRNELIARMDTDDIAREDRFEKQLAEFEKDSKLDICGSHIIEFEGSINNELSRRRVPIKHDDIVKYQKTRSAFNHMTVMYKKEAVVKAGNYEHCPLMEDDILWARMILSGARCSNIDDFLVYARTGIAMIKRRGGLAYFRKYKYGKKKLLSIGFIDYVDYFKAIIPQIFVAIIPSNFRLYVFQKLLRRK